MILSPTTLIIVFSSKGTNDCHLDLASRKLVFKLKYLHTLKYPKPRHAAHDPRKFKGFEILTQSYR